MNSPRVRIFDQPETQVFLKHSIHPTMSVPFIGTGFTGGERASNGVVPFRGEWLESMKKQISSHAGDKKDAPSAADLDQLSFNEVSDVYFSWAIVPLDEIKKGLNDHFFKVEISSQVKRDFLHFPWPYIYTLNIDDAIERVIEGIKVLPYTKSGRHADRRYVYKLHGDIGDLLTAPSQKEMAAIFGTKQYVESIHRNESMLADLTNDLAEKNLLFVGCSLTNELDLLFALSKSSDKPGPSNGLRIFVTGKEPSSFVERKKLIDYGITDVIVVSNYAGFYSFIAELTEADEDKDGPLQQFIFKPSPRAELTPKRRLQYMLQASWKGDPTRVSEARDGETSFIDKITKEPIVAVWGRRFSGRTTLLQRALNQSRDRKCYFIPSTASVSDRLFNQIIKARESIIAIDTGVMFPDQLRRLSHSSARISTNRSTLVIALPRADLNTLGRDFNYESAANHLDFKFSPTEAKLVDKFLDPLGYQKWIAGKTILDNVFSIAESTITQKFLEAGSPLSGKVAQYAKQWKSDQAGRLQFMVLYYMTVRHRIYSKTIRALANSQGAAYLGAALLDSMPKEWQPFIELETSDDSSREAQNSGVLLASNSFAWLRILLTQISEQVGHKESARMIADLYLAMHEIDGDPFDLILFDNLNSIYETRASRSTDWSGALIKQVYENVAGKLSQDPDYWLQRAKATYYISNDASDLRVAAAYCEKGLKERHQKNWSNAQLTKANLLGKACLVERYSSESHVIEALRAYLDVIQDEHLNRSYIDELLKKSKGGKHYLSQLCDAASKMPKLLEARDTVRTLALYLS